MQYRTNYKGLEELAYVYFKDDEIKSLQNGSHDETVFHLNQPLSKISPLASCKEQKPDFVHPLVNNGGQTALRVRRVRGYTFQQSTDELEDLRVCIPEVRHNHKAAVLC
ncbi:hypothetical protein NDU88_010835 [Pleurodeles waltl]|uniref:Uncharacterized protein n=1 Tax=Pleurodeles waltl TaxID=8319 RepID=A0AAV7PWP6_PLEWA|nr:hypothetical protein NDU88_010835 [Pleurodeles waltl]